MRLSSSGAAGNKEAEKILSEIKDHTADAGGSNRCFFRRRRLDPER